MNFFKKNFFSSPIEDFCGQTYWTAVSLGRSKSFLYFRKNKIFWSYFFAFDFLVWASGGCKTPRAILIVLYGLFFSLISFISGRKWPYQSAWELWLSKVLWIFFYQKYTIDRNLLLNHWCNPFFILFSNLKTRTVKLLRYSKKNKEK